MFSIDTVHNSRENIKLRRSFLTHLVPPFLYSSRNVWSCGTSSLAERFLPDRNSSSAPNATGFKQLSNI